MACARCEEPGCNTQLNLQNYTMDRKVDGTVHLLCKTHYKMHFQKSGGVYKYGADRFRKSTSGEQRVELGSLESLNLGSETESNDESASKEAAAPAPAPVVVKATTPVVVKASVTGPGAEKDTDYTLERSVTTPDRRPSLQATVFGTVDKDIDEAAEKVVPEFVRRRSSLRKSVNSAVLEEIAATAHEEANFQSPLSAVKTVGGDGEGGESGESNGESGEAAGKSEEEVKEAVEA